MAAILTTGVLAVGCGGNPGTEISAEAAPAAAAAPAEPAAAEAPSAEALPAPPAHEPAPRPAARPPARPQTPARSARAEAATPASPAPAVPEYQEVTLPAGTTLALALKTALASDVSEREDAVRATLARAVMLNGREVLPAGTEVAGIVTDAERSGRVKGRARIAFQFTSLRFDGERLALQTQPIEQLAEATKGEDATKVGVGAGAGAVIGGLLGGASGAAKGAALGGAAGAGAVMATRGKEVRLEAGSEVAATLAAPLTVRIRL